MNTKINIKFFIIIALVLVMLFLLSTFSLAGEKYSVSMTLTSDSTLNQGEIVAVNVNFSNVDAGNGIDAIVAKLSYDTNVFEIISEDDFFLNNNWNITYNPDTNMLAAFNNNKITQKETIFTIKFKVKSMINVESSTIILNNISVSGGRIIDGGTGDIIVDNASVVIKKPVKKVEIPNYSVEMNLTSNNLFNEGEIVTIYANVVNINAGNGIDSIVAKLNYDTNIFETLTLNDFNTNTGWNIYYDSTTNMLTAFNNNKIVNNQSLFNINLKVKSSVAISSTTIKLQNITVSGGRIIDGGTDDINVKSTGITLNKKIESVSNITDNIKEFSTTDAGNVSAPITNIEKHEIIYDNANINTYTNMNSIVDSDINIISSEIPTIIEDIKDSEISNKTEVVDTSVIRSQNQNNDSINIKNVIIWSTLSTSFILIGYVLFKIY